jgi:nucleoside 2-deoxyribosyltransferase
MNSPKTIYLAGPDVFFAGYDQHKDRLKALCKAANLFALCPADDQLTDDPEPPGQTSRPKQPPLSARIFAQNIALIERADIVMANVQNFRGHEPDSGTVFEIGYAVGKGKKVWCYNVPAQSLVQQIACDSAGLDADGHLVEDFGHARNLMIAHACIQVVGDAQICIAAIRDWVMLPEDLRT